MDEGSTQPWIALKFGGTSVATVDGWAQVASRAQALRPAHRVWIVASALSGVTNRLEAALAEATQGLDSGLVTAVRQQHEALARDLGVEREAFGPVEARLGELERWFSGIRLTGEAPARLRAKILATGELMSTRLGVAALQKAGLDARWVDARELLESRSPYGPSDPRSYLEAQVPSVRDPERAERLAAGAGVVLTQGFIARTPEGETCLLGRGGSDTSGALFAALVGASEFEVWTDVPGLFTADPRLLPSARLLAQVSYREAQELAAMGAKVLHPRSIQPVADHGIPVRVWSTHEPHIEGTRITSQALAASGVTAVTCRRGVTLITLSTLAMWETPGFLARVFQHFADLGVSVDLVGTSQSAVSVTIDPGSSHEAVDELVSRLRALGRVELCHPCAVVSVVGRRIRSVLHELGPALSVFQEFPVHLISDSSEDLNLSFVVDEGHGHTIVSRLHGRLVSAQGGDARLGPTWEKLRGVGPAIEPRDAWWRSRREQLLRLASDGAPRYVYDLGEVNRRARALREQLRSVDRFYYAMKANAHPRVLAVLAEEGFGIECVSAAEVRHVREHLGAEVPLLFTPNFCPIDEYRVAFEAGAEVTIDGASVLEQGGDLFRGQQVALRIDPGRGLGHHEKVKTAGGHTKFGANPDECSAVLEACARLGMRVIGLHAHVGSGILRPDAWAETGRTLFSLAEHFPDVRWLDLGGGLGVPERPGDRELDLGAVEESLAPLRRTLRNLELRMEPGRYLVSTAGVLLAQVTQIRNKGGIRFVGSSAGMSALLRPALYGAWHTIVNLSRLDEPGSDYWHVVGPICETGDVLGRDRWLPETTPGDVLLVENAGAYGAVMASHYNLRPPPEEVVLDASA